MARRSRPPSGARSGLGQPQRARLQGHDDAAQVGLVLQVVAHPLCVQHVVHGHHVLSLPQDAGPHAPQLLHVAAHPQQQPQVHAQRAHVRASLARHLRAWGGSLRAARFDRRPLAPRGAHPEHYEVALGVVLVELALVDGPHAQLPLHCRDERRPLQGQGKGKGKPASAQLPPAPPRRDAQRGDGLRTWKSAPVSVSIARDTCCSPPAGALCRRQMQTYSLPAPCCAFTSRVARSMQTMSEPVTLGSSVPLWPVFSTRSMRLIHATTCGPGGGLRSSPQAVTPQRVGQGGRVSRLGRAPRGRRGWRACPG